jgi:hypothetical protein
MKRNIICWILVCLLAISLTAMTITMVASAKSIPEDSEPVTTFSEADIPSETTFPELTEPEEVVIVLDTVVVERVEPTTYDEANSLLDEATKRQETAQMVLNGLIELGYEPDHPAIVMAYAELENRTVDVAYYQEKQVEWEEIHKWEVRALEYPIATQVWLYMKEEFGWSDIVCAGIMGNMMAECGGCWTSDLDWDVSSSSGYGMIQWLGGRKQQLFNIYGSSPSIEDQLNFMKDELYGINGVTKQVTDNQLNKIMNADSPEDCAYAFACYFERCGEGHRWVRRDYARRAYEYFVG